MVVAIGFSLAVGSAGEPDFDLWFWVAAIVLGGVGVLISVAGAAKSGREPEKTPWFLQWTHSLPVAFVALFSAWLIGGLEVSEPNLWLTILGLVVPQPVMLVGSQYIKQKNGLVGGAAASAVVGVARRLRTVRLVQLASTECISNDR